MDPKWFPQEAEKPRLSKTTLSKSCINDRLYLISYRSLLFGPFKEGVFIKPQFFKSINITVSEEKVYRRLGYSPGLTQLSLGQQEEFRAYYNEAQEFLEPKGVFLEAAIKEKDTEKVVLSDGNLFASRLLASLLKGSDGILIMAATSGSGIVEAINKNQKGNMTKAVVYDALAGEAADACIDWLQQYCNRNLSREGAELLSRRISCGYGDFSHKYQKVLFDILDLGKLGLKINAGNMLIPEKSVIAVTGIIKGEF
ncbi:MAG: methionine synthase [Candidatus Omnitrophota bacterium]